MTLTTRAVGYSDGETELAGYLAVDDARHDRRPGILLVHGGAGLDDHARQQTRRYAGLGYVVFAADMYGAAAAGDRVKVMTSMLGLLSDSEAMLRRGLAGLRALADSPHFNGQTAALGFCFGGAAVLDLARRGLDVAGVVSIHGSLASSHRCRPGSIKAKVLVCHGGRDPHVPLEQVTAFIEEMDNARVDCQVIVYGGAWHGFTHERPTPGLEGMAYDRCADRRSFVAVRTFLTEIFEARGRVG